MATTPRAPMTRKEINNRLGDLWCIDLDRVLRKAKLLAAALQSEVVEIVGTGDPYIARLEVEEIAEMLQHVREKIDTLSGDVLVGGLPPFPASLNN